MKTTVVIPNYNGKKYLINCLKSLEENTQVPFQLILVDNGSTDGSAEEAVRRYPWVRLISFEQNRGFCAAVNEGIRQAGTPYVFLLNNDTVIEPGCIEQLERRMDEDARIFSVAARMVNMADPSVMDGAGDLYSALGWAYAIGKGHKAEGYDRPRTVFSASGGAALYRKEYLEKTGLFDELHFAYLEDVDLGYRARICGYRNVYEPGAAVLHAGSASTGSRYNAFKIIHSSRNNIYLIYKNMPPLQLLLNLPFLAAGFLVKILFFIRKGYGAVYWKGLAEGVLLCTTPEARKRRVRFKMYNFGNYIRIQLELWINIFRRI